jgi:abortive infection bacteriophage resistance protein
MEEDHYEEFLKAVPGEELTMILRVHLLTEYFLEKVISLTLPFGDRLLKDSRFTYVQKLALVRSFGTLRDDLHCGLKKLNKIRNKCAHVRNRQITEEDLESIGQCLGENYREVLERENKEFRYRLLHVLSMLSAGLSALIEALVKKRKTT